jgi:hypothetical protein
MCNNHFFAKKVLLLFGVGLCFCLFCGGAVHAASTLLIATSGPGVAMLTDLTGGNFSRTLGIITIDSQFAVSPNGFRLQIASLKLGGLVRRPTPSTYADSGLIGDVAPYTFSLEPNGNGSLGCAEPALPTNHTLATAISLDFNQAIVANTVAKEYKFVFTIPAKSSLFAGTFGDVLTVTLSDL